MVMDPAQLNIKAASVLLDAVSVMDPDDLESTRAAGLRALAALGDFRALPKTLADPTEGAVDATHLTLGALTLLRFLVDELGAQPGIDRHAVIAAARDYLAGRDYGLP